MADVLDSGRFECAICYDLLLDPVVLKCGHDFCQHCLQQWRASQLSHSQLSHRTIRCPFCRSDLGTDPDTLGVCVRLRDMIDLLFPAKVAARRRDVAADAGDRGGGGRAPCKRQGVSSQANAAAAAALVAAMAAGRRPQPTWDRLPAMAAGAGAPGGAAAAGGAPVLPAQAWGGGGAGPAAAGSPPLQDAAAAAMAAAVTPTRGQEPSSAAWHRGEVAFTMGWYERRPQPSGRRRQRRSIRSRARG